MRCVSWGLTVLAVVALASAGCVAYVWQRPGTPAAVIEQDTRECDDQARRIAQDYDLRASGYGPWLGPHRGPFWPADPFFWPAFPEPSLAFERRTAQRCMEARGYRLVKQPPEPEEAKPASE
jgi:hypothetical protein